MTLSPLSGGDSEQDMFPMDDVNDAEDETTDVESWKGGHNSSSHSNSLGMCLIGICLS